VKRKDLLRPNGPSYLGESLGKAIPLNYQMDFRRTSGNRSGLLLVCLGQAARLPAAVAGKLCSSAQRENRNELTGSLTP
jgi:hypothetical protein